MNDEKTIVLEKLLTGKSPLFKTSLLSVKVLRDLE
jgi:hypothetical protein